MKLKLQKLTDTAALRECLTVDGVQYDVPNLMAQTLALTKHKDRSHTAGQEQDTPEQSQQPTTAASSSSRPTTQEGRKKDTGKGKGKDKSKDERNILTPVDHSTTDERHERRRKLPMKRQEG